MAGHEVALAPGAGFEIPCEATPSVRAALQRIGRAEDVTFSPSNRRLALACLARNSIAIAELTITLGADGPRVTLTDLAEYSAPCLDAPHGVDFADEDTLIVANRHAHVDLLRLPSDARPAERGALTQIALPPGGGFDLVSSPGSVCARRRHHDAVDVLIGNGWSSTVTSHRLHDEPWSVASSEVLLHRWLDVPDGLAVSRDDQWLAVSSHDLFLVMLYRRASSLDENSDPDCILRGTICPHGLEFTPDSQHLFVADAGMPYVHIYARGGLSWQGVRSPVASLRVMDDDVFRMGRDALSGGPKGVDIDRDGQVLAVCFENQPVTFFDVAAMLEGGAQQPPDPSLSLTYELESLKRGREKADARIAKLLRSRSFRITKPLRRLNATLTRKRR